MGDAMHLGESVVQDQLAAARRKTIAAEEAGYTT